MSNVIHSTITPGLSYEVRTWGSVQEFAEAGQAAAVAQGAGEVLVAELTAADMASALEPAHRTPLPEARITQAGVTGFRVAREFAAQSEQSTA